MKKLIPLLLLFYYWATLFSQTPQSVPYQAVARNSTGNLMQNKGISLRFTIHDSTASGIVLYQETQAATTNSLGLFNVNIGLGTVLSGTFSGIAWGNGNAKYMQVELDPNGGTNYTNLGASQMMSVPYALYAANAGASMGAAGGDLTGTYPNPSLAAAGTAGTYTKVTTDIKGRVISGTVLSAGDVPTLNQSTTGNAATATNVTISGLTAATATNTIDNLNYVQTWNWSTASTQNPLSINSNGLSSGTAFTLASTSTAGVASGSSYLLKLSRSGANSNTAHSAYGIYSTVSNTNTTSGTNIAGYFSASGATTANYGLLVAAGNVGIGTTTPAQSLDVNGTGLFRNGNTGSAFTNNQILFGYAGNATYQHAIKTRHNSGAAAGNDIDFYTWNYGTDASTAVGIKQIMTLDGTGNVGIGATTPGYQLTLAGAGAVTAFAVDNGNTFAAKNYNSTASSEVYENYLWPRWTDNVMYINYGSAGFNIRNDASTPTMFMTSGNDVGIGTTSPGALLEISRGTDATQFTGTGADMVIQARNAATGDARLAFVSNDNVGNSGAGIIDGWANSYGGGASKAVEISFPTSQGGATSDVNGNIAFSVNKGTSSTLTEAMRITSNAYVGIGTPSPSYPLQVSGSANSSGSYYYYCGSGCSNGTSSGAYPLSIVAGNGIQCTQLNIPSDMRIKNIIGYSNGAEDLQTLQKIRITNYKMRDEAVYGEKINKKVIAQQVKEVYPLAVQNAGGIQYVPNIYQPAKGYKATGHILTIELPKPIVADKDTKIGSLCKLYLYGLDSTQHEVNTKIVELQGNMLKVKTSDSLDYAMYNGNAFVYGTEISDFLAVDYDAISMLNVSATQELARKMEALEKQNTALINANQKLDEQNCELAQKVDALSSVSNEVQLLHEQMNVLKARMEKNGLRTEK